MELKFNCVLLIDDDGITNFINHRLIKKLNITHSIESAINGNEALLFLREYAIKNNNKSPELILLDLNMPVLDGFEFLEEFQKLNFDNKEKVRILILTTSTHQKDIGRLVGNSNISYINKPLTEEKLIETFKGKTAGMGI